MSEEHQCVICQRRPYERAQACQPCRTRLPHILTDIEELSAQLPLALPRDQSAAQRVSGSREAPVPLNLDVVDLTLGTRVPNPTAAGATHPEDQIGHDSVAARLDQWVRDWKDEMAFTQSLPVPTVPELCRWLRDRADWACDRHPAVDEFAAEIVRLRGILRGVLGMTDPEPDYCDGVVCKSCDRYALYRDGKYVECGKCGMLYTEDEYQEWVALMDADTKRRVAAGELEMPKHMAAEKPGRTGFEVNVDFPRWVQQDERRAA